MDKICNQCKKEFKRFVNLKTKFCSKSCAGKFYSENFKHSDESKKKMSKARVNFKPWNKGLTSKEDNRILSGEKNPAFGKTYKTKKDNPEWAENIRASSKGKINLGDKNGMKQLEARAKVSATRKEMFKDETLRKKLSDSSK